MPSSHQTTVVLFETGGECEVAKLDVTSYYKDGIVKKQNYSHLNEEKYKYYSIGAEYMVI